MELYVQEGGQTRNPSEASVAPGDWTIFPIGWPGPEPSFGIVRSVTASAALVHDIAFGMDVEFRIDLVEKLTSERRAEMTAPERTALERAARQANAAWAERRAA